MTRSDYFGALIRSSGMTITDRVPPMAAPRTDTPMPVDLDSRRDAMSTAAVPPAAPAVRQASMSTFQAPETAPQDRFAQPSPMPAEQAGRNAQPVGRVSDASMKVRQRSPSESTSAEAPTQAADVRSAERAPVLGRIVVRAAMQWVAAGPREVGATPSVTSMIAPLAEPVAPATVGESRHANSCPAIHDEIPPDSAPGIARPGRTAAAEPADGPVLRLARPAAVHAERIATPALREEPVEISIGAIHVRVDAPTAQTVARTLAPPPAPRPRASDGPSIARSALGRRALRRI